MKLYEFSLIFRTPIVIAAFSEDAAMKIAEEQTIEGIAKLHNFDGLLNDELIDIDLVEIRDPKANDLDEDADVVEE